MKTIKTILIVLLVLVGGFIGVKLAGAYMDVSGIQSDIQAKAGDIPFDCAGSRRCGDQLVDTVEALREEHKRDVVLDYESADIDAESNKFFMQGMKVIDFKVNKVVWNFLIEVDLPK